MSKGKKHTEMLHRKRRISRDSQSGRRSEGGDLHVEIEEGKKPEQAKEKKFLILIFVPTNGILMPLGATIPFREGA